MTTNVEENIFLARVAEQAERFEDMVSYLAAVLDEKGADVSADERNLLSVAFKNLISSLSEADVVGINDFAVVQVGSAMTTIMIGIYHSYNLESSAY